jgi:histidinol dehydrogenase
MHSDIFEETTPGVKCWQKTMPIEKVGLYIPGGSAPLLSTVLMLGVPATLAGCSEIILCTPPGENGKISPGILYIANLLGIEKVFRLGGVQAIAAMAYGTESVPKVNKIFGPGNQYVTAAKQLVSRDAVAIDCLRVHQNLLYWQIHLLSRHLLLLTFFPRQSMGPTAR